MSVGLTLGSRYELIAQLGAGGFGSVWRAHDMRLRRDVAVKLLHLTGADIPRFEREAQALAQLNHPNIVTVHDFGVQDTTAYLVLELIGGRALADELAIARAAGHIGLPLDRVVDVADQILDGLSAAHVAGFIHRDLKPDNVMTVPGGHRIKIVDFGIAHATELTRMTATGAIIGTLPYMSPEQLNGDPLDGRADLYSLGCMLYELLTGVSPYRASTPASWIQAHHFQAPAHVRERLPDVPDTMEAFIQDLLAKDPAQRLDDAEAAREALAAVYRPRHPSPIRPAMTHTVAAITADVGPPGSADTSPPSAIRGLASLTGHTGEVLSVAFSPDGTILASGGQDTTVQLWDVASQANIGTLAGHTGEVLSVAFSPDGKTLVSAGRDKTARLWDVASRTNTATLAGHTYGVFSVAFSPDGRTLAGGGWGRSVRLWDAASYQEIVTLTPRSNGVHSVAFSPDGKTLASASAAGYVPIRLWDVASHTNIATLTDRTNYTFSVAFSPDGTILASGGRAKTVQLWDVASQANIGTLTGHTGEVLSVAFSPDGKTLASAGRDKTIRLWDVTSRTNTATLTDHTGEVCSVVFSPDGRTLASGGWDKMILLWRVG